MDYLDARYWTPYLEELQGYDVVITYPNYAYDDPVYMGDVLADFVDIGGRVILMTFCTFTELNFLAGRIMTPGYTPYFSPNGGNHFSADSLGAVPGCCVTDGVTQLSCFFRDYLREYPGTTTCAYYTDGEILAGHNHDRTVYYLNGYIPDAYYQTGWDGDWYRAVWNAIMCFFERRAKIAEEKWLSASPAPPAGEFCGNPSDECDLVVPPSISRGPECLRRTSESTITYVICQSGDTTRLVQGVDVAVAIYPEQKSGGHCHEDPDRPTGTHGGQTSPPNPVIVTGNTGSGDEFRVTHVWPEVAGQLEVRFYATDPSHPLYNDPDIVFRYCVSNTGLMLLPDAPGLYTRTASPPGGDNDLTRHPDHWYGSPEAMGALTEVAQDFRFRFYPDLVAYNDLSLPWGGLFDLCCCHECSGDWKTPHIEHRLGEDCDVRTASLTFDERLSLLYMLEEKGFDVVRHGSFENPGHYHARYSICPLLAAGELPATPGAPGASLDGLLVTVTDSVAYDPTSGLWTYLYSLANHAASQGVVHFFGLTGIHEPVASSHPQHWMGKYGFARAPDVFMWGIADAGNPPPGWIDEGDNTYPSEFATRPGETTMGFRIVSPFPPDSVQYFAKAWQELPLVIEEETHSFWETGTWGMTIGPASQSTEVRQGIARAEGNRADLLSVTPNPGSSLVSLSYSVASAGVVKLEIYDVGGRRVSLLVDRVMPIGTYCATWDRSTGAGVRVGPGIYLARLTVGNEVSVRKIVLTP